MKILHVVDSLSPGGMENGVVNLIRGLAPEFEGHVACLTRRGAFAERLPAPERVVVLGKTARFTPLAAWRLAGHIRRLRPAVLHTHNLGPLIYATLATLGGRLCPILHGEHSLLTDAEKTPRKLRQRQRFYRACRAVHAVAPVIRDELFALGCAHPHFHVIPNGVDTARFSPGDRSAARRELGLPDDGSLLGLIGRFGPQKGHAALIEAFESVVRTRPDCRLVFVGGGGPCEEAIRARAARSAASAHIHFTGLLADPLPAYRALDLLVIPSTNEGMSNAALEAMSCGVPILGNTGCGHETLIANGREGVLADLRDPSALAREIARLLDAPARLVEFGHAARVKVDDSFSIGTMLASYGELYRSLCGTS